MFKTWIIFFYRIHSIHEIIVKSFQNLTFLSNSRLIPKGWKKNCPKPWRVWSRMTGCYWWGRLAVRLTGRWSPSVVCIRGSSLFLDPTMLPDTVSLKLQFKGKNKWMLLVYAHKSFKCSKNCLPSWHMINTPHTLILHFFLTSLHAWPDYMLPCTVRGTQYQSIIL